MANGTERIGLIGRIAGMRTFRIQLAVLVALYTLLAYGALYYQTQRSIDQMLYTQGSSYFDLVKATRVWNAELGGVWVAKHPGVETNPYLLEIGIPADIKTESGADLTLRNPAAMMTEISNITEMGTGVSFHLVSQDALNPDNSPDDWENSALRALETGEVEFVEMSGMVDGEKVYRYIEPLEVDATCTGCHQGQGYNEGDLRGGITINIPLDAVDRQLESTVALLAGLALITLALAVAASQWFAVRLNTRLEEANELLSEMAVTDDLTGLSNRRALFDRLGEEFSRSKRTQTPISTIILDIDHFKRINDQYGHAVGDGVLREIAARMEASLREYDSLGRIGGEEFAVVSPGTDLEAGHALAGRMLEMIRSSPFSINDLELNVRCSAGVATISVQDERSDELLARADDALYQAKNDGRDRVRTEEDLKL